MTYTTLSYPAKIEIIPDDEDGGSAVVTLRDIPGKWMELHADDETENAAKRILCEWLAAYLLRGETPPSPSEPVAGEIMLEVMSVEVAAAKHVVTANNRMHALIHGSRTKQGD